MSNALPTIQEEDEPKRTSQILTKPSFTGNQLPRSKVSLAPLSQTHVISIPSIEYQSESLIKSSTRKHSQNQQIGDGNRKGIVPKKPSFITHLRTNSITLTEDCFGLYKDQDGNPVKVQRYTWTSSSRASVQIITYGARIASIKFPDKNGIIDDIVLGFSDLAGYLYYGEHFFGATIGVMTNKIRDSTFELDGRTITLRSNVDPHHADGGCHGLDKVIWNSYVSGSKVILTHTVHHKHEGVPGPIMITISYELTPQNEFRIDMEAKTVRPTIINLSNLCYFNLGGHHGGPEELHNHSVVINSNCYTLMDDDDFPTGSIMNVVHTKYDFSTPKLMKNFLGAAPDDGFDQNLCINRATAQRNCFVARVVHVLNGRVLEMYSNQYGVRFETANNFGLGVISPPTPPEQSLKSESFSLMSEGGVFVLLNRVYETMNTIEEFNEKNFKEVHNLMKKIRHYTSVKSVETRPSKPTTFANPDFCVFGFLHALELSVTQVRNIIPENIDDITTWSELKFIVDEMLRKYQEMDAVVESNDEIASEMEENVHNLDETEPAKLTKSVEMQETTGIVATTKSENSQQSLRDEKSKSLVKGDEVKSQLSAKGEGSQSAIKDDELQQSVHEMKSQQSITDEFRSSSKSRQPSNDVIAKMASVTSEKSNKSGSCHKSEGNNESIRTYSNVIPDTYKDGRIHGKNNAIYRRYGAMAFQTQNYPDSIHHDNFPSPILRPGQTYKHTIVYKLWTKNDGLNALKTKRKCQ